ncbi:FecR domain-containing protein [Pedobacter sp. ASV1-7]|uniref:FecR family protein n=1 Tax=Pedobacter sp. ASV1-7 TaxID=3145237 RepID=UPI0032E8A5FC
MEKYKAGNCSEEEKAIVESWYLQLSTHHTPEEQRIDHTKREVWEVLMNHRRKARMRTRFNIFIRVAAVLAILTLSIILYIRSSVSFIQKDNKTVKTDKILPGGNKAYLTLANGKKISLTDAANGTIQQQTGLTIRKTADGTLVYEVVKLAQQSNQGKTLYNTIETPKGGQYQINLPDGTKVWLNAASSLRYPMQFVGSERIVDLYGEGYFEVAKSGNQKFIVRNGLQQVEVLGTHFNINAYKDEASVKTTLLEGSVRVLFNAGKNKELSRLLKPGQQSEQTGENIDVRNVDTENVIAWKKGDFIFNGEELSGIMRKIARWYDVEVVYKGSFDDLKFGGYISRSKNISSVLGIMESTGKIHFKIQGKTITVLKSDK